MGNQWYYSRGDNKLGPVSGTELKQLASSGQLAPTDMVWKEGMPKWVKATRLKRLFAAPISETLPPVIPASPPSPSLTTVTTPIAVRIESDDISIGVNLHSQAMGTALIAGFHRQRFAIAIAAGIGMFATFLPWFHVPIVEAVSRTVSDGRIAIPYERDAIFGPVYGTAGYGWFTMALFIPAMVLALRGTNLKPILGTARLGATIPAGIAALIGIFKIAAFKSKMGEDLPLVLDIFGEGVQKEFLGLIAVPLDIPFLNSESVFVRIGIGIYVVIMAGVSLAVLAWILADEPKDKMA